jgi:hypothetical protein
MQQRRKRTGKRLPKYEQTKKVHASLLSDHRHVPQLASQDSTMSRIETRVSMYDVLPPR